MALISNPFIIQVCKKLGRFKTLIATFDLAANSTLSNFELTLDLSPVRHHSESFNPQINTDTLVFSIDLNGIVGKAPLEVLKKYIQNQEKPS